ncbi:clumping factor B-like isoform X2 [Scylla paramamosain]|uniref:clumping factor B-like isoform X2 n=1 Tax=Scylla paramamosain TaxID=85552 RepID=UPI003083BB39
MIWWIVVCLVTLATSARLPGDERDPEQHPLIVSSVSLPGDQRRGPVSSLGSETKGELAMNLTDGADRTDGHAGKTTGSISFISTGDGEGMIRGDYSDSTSDEGHENKHDSRSGYNSHGHYKEYSYYDHAGYRDNGHDHGRDDVIDFIHLNNGGEESAKELMDWDSYYVLRNRAQNCSDGGGGVYLCLQDSEDEDTDDSDECAHDDEDCDDSRARLRAYLGRDEDEEEEGSEVEMEDEDDEYLLSLKYLDDDSDEDDGSDDVDEEDSDDDDDDDVYFYVDSNDTSLASFLTLPTNPKKSDGALRETKHDRNEKPVKISEAEQREKYVHVDKAKQSPPTDKSENVPEEIVVKSPGEVACNEIGCFLGGAADDGEAAEGDGRYASRMETSPVLGSNMQQDPSFANDTPTIARKREIHADYIGRNELHDVFKEFEGPVPKEDEQRQPATHSTELTSRWFENTAPGVSDIDTLNTNLNAVPKAITEYEQNFNFAISEHDTTPYEEIYDTIMHSGQVSDEEKSYIASLEQLRRLVNRLGGFETLLEKPEVHHIVKRQTNGAEACVLLRRRRKRAADEAGETERASRTKRGISNVGRNLEQGNPRFRQLFSQYRSICDFLSMVVFEK